MQAARLSTGQLPMPRLAFNGIDIQAQTIRELPAHIPLSVAKKTIESDGLDQIIFEANHTRYIASGAGLNFSGIDSDALPEVQVGLKDRVVDAITFSRRLQVEQAVPIQAQFLGQDQEIKLLDIDNETNTAQEGAKFSVAAAGGTLAFSGISGAIGARFIAGPPLKALSASALGSQALIPRLRAKLTILQHDGVNWGAKMVQKIPGLKNRPLVGYAVVIGAIGVAALAVGAGIGAVGAKMRTSDDEALMDMTRPLNLVSTPQVLTSGTVGATVTPTEVEMN